jgi:hypothetical protein
MRYAEIAPSHLPSLLLPCPYCGHRMAITVIAPALLDNGAESSDLEDITHRCLQCGTTPTRTVRVHSPDELISIPTN